MKVRYATPDQRLAFEFEAQTDKQVFAQLARIQEVFEESACGCCGSHDVHHEVREFDGNNYYKLVCAPCGATLDFGQNKVGDTLYPKRLHKDTRAALPHRGWYRYQESHPEAQQAAAPAAKAPTPAAKPAPAPSQERHEPRGEDPTPYQKAIAGMHGAKTKDLLDQWAKWSKLLRGLTPRQLAKLEDVYQEESQKFQDELVGAA